MSQTSLQNGKRVTLQTKEYQHTSLKKLKLLYSKN